MKHQYLQQLKKNALERKTVDKLLMVFEENGFNLTDIKDYPEVLAKNVDGPKITESLSSLDLYVCQNIKSWNGLIIGFPGGIQDLSTENVETPYLRKILYPIMDLFRRVENRFGPLDCLYIIGARFNEVFRLKISLLEYGMKNVVILTNDLLNCSQRTANKLPKEQSNLNEAWIQRELCRQLSEKNGLTIDFNGEKTTLKLVAYEVPTNEGTLNPERLDILAYDTKDKSLVAFEIKGKTGRAELENLYLQGMAHRNWLEQNKRAIRFLFDPKGPKGRMISTRKRVRLILGFVGNDIPGLFLELKEKAKHRDRHLEIDFVRFELPSGVDGNLVLNPNSQNDTKPALVSKETSDSKFAKIKWKPEKLKQIGLPDCEYPIPSDILPEVLANGEVIRPEYLLCWLQEYSSTLSEGWGELEPTMTALLNILAPDDTKMESSVEGDDWALHIGPVDLTKKIVTIQRGGRILAAINPLEDESLRLAIYAPLDANSLRRLYAMAAKRLTMSYNNNWEMAVVMGNKSYQAALSLQQGQSYTSIWDYGLGINYDKQKDEDYYQQRDITPVRAAVAATQLGVYYELGEIDVV